jgi:hypothetical protein
MRLDSISAFGWNLLRWSQSMEITHISGESFYLLHSVQINFGAHLASYFSQEVKRTGREAHQFSPSSADLKNS